MRGFRPSGIAWAAGGVGLVTFVATILVMSMVFGGGRGGDDARVPQAAAECEPSACADESPAVPQVSEGPAGRDHKSEPSPTRSASASPSPSASPSSASPSSASPTPRATRSRTASPSPSRPSRTNGRVTIRYVTANDWRGTFHGSYVVANESGSDLPSWRLTFSYPPRKLTALWPQTWQRFGHTIVVSGGALPRGGRTTIFFQGNGDPLRPYSCTFNGTACTPG
ncbi:cellulose binding domain-containing protein [Actinomadura miaoliensis]|uniref:cellulose binding domain-containing protein n=1 Tax=Actinomadura miaoliensis TaxID=430685 RepID=UPI0031E8DB00